MAWAGSQYRSIAVQRSELAQLARYSPGTVFAGENVVLLSLRSSTISDAELDHVSRLPYLEWLDLEGASVTDAGVRNYRS